MLATDLQGQVDELKDKVIKIETNTNNQAENNNNKDQHHHEARVHKRQANKQSSNACASSSLLCSYYYRDHPDSRSSTAKPKIGMPTSCKDLQLLGHRLNGFYSVKKSQSSNEQQGTKMEIVYCDFQITDPKGYIATAHYSK